MERRHFLKVALGVAAGAAALATSVEAAPLAPQPLVAGGTPPPANEAARPAVTSAAEAESLQPEQVRWGWHHHHHHHRHWGWHRRHWGWHRRHWRRWHRRHWRRRFW